MPPYDGYTRGLTLPVDQAQADVTRLERELAAARQKLAVLRDPWHGLSAGQARVVDGRVHAVVSVCALHDALRQDGPLAVRLTAEVVK